MKRILDIARTSFAAGGYDASTTRKLAARVGITSGALYHYFGSKLDLYLAVHHDVQALICTRVNAAVEGATGFLDKFDAVLDVASELNRDDASFAGFLGTARSDMRRHPDIEAALGAQVRRRDEFFEGLVGVGVKCGEISPVNRDVAIEFITVILNGLTDNYWADLELHNRAVRSIRIAMRGQLFNVPDHESDTAIAAS